LSVFLAYNQSPAGQWLCPLFADNLPHYQTPDEKHMTNEEILAQFGPREAMEYDVVVVGGGPGGLSTAIRIKQLAAERGQDVSVVVLEKGSEPGAHILSGAIMDPKALTELIPDWKEKGAPLNQPVTDDAYSFLSERSAFRVPNMFLPPFAHNHGNYIVSLGAVTKWLAEQAEAWAWKSSPASPPPKCSTTTTVPSRAWPPAIWASARTASPPTTSSSAWNCWANTPSLPKAHAATWASKSSPSTSSTQGATRRALASASRNCGKSTPRSTSPAL
jgi:hypothetical protein